MAEPMPQVNVRKQILALEKKLAQALVERDDLARDVEALCMETTSNTTFSSSSVLRERIFSTEKELSKARSELVTVASERDSLKEDLKEIKDAKKLVDQSFRDQQGRVDTMQRELEFYRQQAAQAISQRDNTLWECEQLRQTSMEASAQAQEAVSRAESAEVERKLAERRAAEAELRAEQLQGEAQAAKSIPALHAEIERYKSHQIDLEGEIKSLKDRLATMEAEMQDLGDKYRVLEEDNSEVRQELAEVTSQKIQSLIRLSEEQSARSKADSQISRLQHELKQAQDRIIQATQEKVAALMQLAELRAAENNDQSTKQQDASRSGTPLTSPRKLSTAAAAMAAAAAATPDVLRGWFNNGNNGTNGTNPNPASPPPPVA